MSTKQCESLRRCARGKKTHKGHVVVESVLVVCVVVVARCRELALIIQALATRAGRVAIVDGILLETPAREMTVATSQAASSTALPCT